MEQFVQAEPGNHNLTRLGQEFKDEQPTSAEQSPIAVVGNQSAAAVRRMATVEPDDRLWQEWKDIGGGD